MKVNKREKALIISWTPSFSTIKINKLPVKKTGSVLRVKTEQQTKQ